MKPLYFKIFGLMLITSFSINAQKKTIYSEFFNTNENSTVIFNLENTTVAIEVSEDDNIYFDYTIEFNNYSKKDIESLINNINVEATKFENNITLMATSLTNISKTAYYFDSPFGVSFDNLFKSDSTENIVYRKSKDSLIKESKETDDISFENSFKRFEYFDKNGERKPIDLNTVKMYKSRFVIKLPVYVKLKINAKHGGITFLDNMTNEISVNQKKGTFKGKSFVNSYNNFEIDQANFKVEALSGGDYTFTNVSKGKIGSLQNIKITSEFSKIELGEIQDQVIISDFNGEYWFYNWAKDFKRFDFFSEYSKVYLFHPENYDYSLSVFGNNTVNHLKNISATMQPTKNNEKFKMMERTPKGDGHFSGAINFDIVRGIIYNTNDTFIKVKK